MAFQVIRVLLAFIISSALHAQASSPELTDITGEDLKNVIRDMTGIFAHTTLSSAALYTDDVRGEIGLVIGSAETPHVDDISQRSDPEADVSMIPHTSLIANYYFTEQIRFELSYLPEIKTSKIQLASQSIALQYTATDPKVSGLDVAFKFYVTSSEVHFDQATSSGDMKVKYKSNVTGLMMIFSEKILILEPYFGIGRLNSQGRLKVSGSGTIFDTAYTTSNTAEESATGNHLMYGVNFDIFALQAGIEVLRTFNANKLSAKFSFNF
ncbi:MAG: hypothetical protein AABZ31_07755 [Bdellovibrionota bacterium]